MRPGKPLRVILNITSGYEGNRINRKLLTAGSKTPAPGTTMSTWGKAASPALIKVDTVTPRVINFFFISISVWCKGYSEGSAPGHGNLSNLNHRNLATEGKKNNFKNYLHCGHDVTSVFWKSATGLVADRRSGGNCATRSRASSLKSRSPMSTEQPLPRSFFANARPMPRTKLAGCCTTCICSR